MDAERVHHLRESPLTQFPIPQRLAWLDPDDRGALRDLVADERAPVPFPEKAAFLRREAEAQRDKDMLRLVASVYDAHPDWREEWRA